MPDLIVRLTRTCIGGNARVSYNTQKGGKLKRKNNARFLGHRLRERGKMRAGSIGTSVLRRRGEDCRGARSLPPAVACTGCQIDWRSALVRQHLI